METVDEKKADELFNRCVDFIRDIGIPVHFRAMGDDGFLPGISISHGEIIVDMEKMKYPGDILHEAGHIAIVPANERSELNAASIAQRTSRDAEEMMAIAWSYAACVYLNMDSRFVFHDHGYKEGGSSIAENFDNGRYVGVPMLQWVGMALEKKNADEPGKPVYPDMLQWLRS
ncbi:MAG: hypothetical protein ACRDEB_05430 [Chitinophagaceae bacterium]